MKKLHFIVVIVSALILPRLGQGQTVVSAKSTPTATPSQVLGYAIEAKQLMGAKTYEPLTIRKRIDKSSPLYKFLPHFDRGNEIINKVIRAGSSLSPTDALKYEKEMEEVDSGIKRLIAITQVADIPTCFKGCDTNYPGIGGGNGWKRFTCKTACLIAEVAD